MAGSRHKPWTSEDCPARRDPSVPSKGGRACARKKAILRSMREWARVIAGTAAKDRDFAEMTLGGKVVKAQFDSAIGGDTRAAEFIAKLTGELADGADIRIVPRVLDDVPTAQ